MKKADMEHHTRRYDACLAEARGLERNGLYRQAMEAAFSAWEHVDGMMQYRRKYEDQGFSTIAAIEIVLKYAPLMFDFDSLDTLERMLKETRRLEKNTDECLADRLAQARRQMSNAHRLWTHLEMTGGVRQDSLRRDLGGDQTEWRQMVDVWEKMGILSREPDGGNYRLYLLTRMGAIVDAKCPACGVVHQGPKSMFLDEQRCPDCKQSGRFVLLCTNEEGD